MEKKQRKKTTVATSTAFFLCFYAFPSIYALSVQELLLHSPSTYVDLLEEKTPLSSNSLSAYLEPLPSSLKSLSLDDDFIYLPLRLFENIQHPSTTFLQSHLTIAIAEKASPIILQPKQSLFLTTNSYSFLKTIPSKASTLLSQDKGHTYFIACEQPIINPNFPISQSPPLSISDFLNCSTSTNRYNFQFSPNPLLISSNLPTHNKFSKNPLSSPFSLPHLSLSTPCKLEKKIFKKEPLLASYEPSNVSHCLEKQLPQLAYLPIDNSLFPTQFTSLSSKEPITYHPFLDSTKTSFSKTLSSKNSLILRPSLSLITEIRQELKLPITSTAILENTSANLTTINEINDPHMDIFLISKNYCSQLQSHLSSFFVYYIAFEEDLCPTYSLDKQKSSLNPKNISYIHGTLLHTDTSFVKNGLPSQECFNKDFVVLYPNLTISKNSYASIPPCCFQQTFLTENLSQNCYVRSTIEIAKPALLLTNDSFPTTPIEAICNTSKKTYSNLTTSDPLLISTTQHQPEAVSLVFEKPNLTLLKVKLYESSSKIQTSHPFKPLDSLYVFQLLKDDSTSSQSSSRFMQEIYSEDSPAIVCLKKVPLKTSLSLQETSCVEIATIPDPSTEQFFVMKKSSPTFLKDFYKESQLTPYVIAFTTTNNDIPSLILDPLYHHLNNYILNRPTSLNSAYDSLEFLSLSPIPPSYIPQSLLEIQKPTLSEEPTFAITVDYTHVYNSFKHPLINLTATTSLAFLKDFTTSWLAYTNTYPIPFTKQAALNYSTNLNADTLNKKNKLFATHIKEETPLIFAKAQSELQISLAKLPGLHPQIHQISSLPNPFLYCSINNSLAFKQTNKTPSLTSRNKDLTPTQATSYTANKNARTIQKNQVKLPTLEELHTATLSDDFDIQVEVIPMPKEKGYLFAVTLTPPQEESLPHAAQNIIFLMDRSSSIEKNRFQVFKQAISKSLTYLHEGDTFNILSFDMELSKMSHESVFITPSSKLAAQRFLENQRRGYKYILPNLYEILLTAHSMAKTSELPTTVILLTNGSNLDKFNVHNDRLSHLVSNNKGTFSLFTACASHNNNTLMLEILSHLNKGELMHSQTHAAFPRKLATLVKHAGNLVAQDIHVNAIQVQGNSKIELLADTSTAPNLYSDRSYTILGKIDELYDFDLVLQGRFCQNWINITKKISFKTAKTGNYAIYKNYSMKLAYQQYNEFLKEGNTAYLDSATKVFHPFTPLN